MFKKLFGKSPAQAPPSRQSSAPRTPAESEYEEWSRQIDSAPMSAEEFFSLGQAVLDARGSWVTGTDADGSQRRFRFYRDVEVTVRYFPEMQGMEHVLTVCSPRFADPSLSVMMDPREGPALITYKPGKWLEHLQTIKHFPRTDWRQMAEYDDDHFGHAELSGEVLLAAGMLSAEGQRYTSETMTSLKRGAVLHRQLLSTCRLDSYSDEDGSPLLLQVISPNEEHVAQFMHHSQRGWQCTSFHPGPWIDELLEAYEAYERQRGTRNG